MSGLGSAPGSANAAYEVMFPLSRTVVSVENGSFTFSSSATGRPQSRALSRSSKTAPKKNKGKGQRRRRSADYESEHIVSNGKTRRRKLQQFAYDIESTHNNPRNNDKNTTTTTINNYNKPSPRELKPLYRYDYGETQAGLRATPVNIEPPALLNLSRTRCTLCQSKRSDFSDFCNECAKTLTANRTGSFSPLLPSSQRVANRGPAAHAFAMPSSGGGSADPLSYTRGGQNEIGCSKMSIRRFGSNTPAWVLQAEDNRVLPGGADLSVSLPASLTMADTVARPHTTASTGRSHKLLSPCSRRYAPPSQVSFFVELHANGEMKAAPLSQQKASLCKDVMARSDYAVAKSAADAANEKPFEMHEMNFAAEQIQFRWAGFKARKDYKRLLRASTAIQNRYRSHTAKRVVTVLRKKHKASLVIQTQVRGHQIRKRVKPRVINRRFISFQSYVRMGQAKVRVHKIRMAILLANQIATSITLQKIVRGFLARRRAAMIRLRQHSATLIQKVFRRHVVVADLNMKRGMATIIQSWIRRYLAEKKVAKIRVTAEAIERALKVAKAKAAIVIQRMARVWLSRKKYVKYSEEVQSIRTMLYEELTTPVGSALECFREGCRIFLMQHNLNEAARMFRQGIGYSEREAALHYMYAILLQRRGNEQTDDLNMALSHIRTAKENDQQREVAKYIRTILKTSIKLNLAVDPSFGMCVLALFEETMLNEAEAKRYFLVALKTNPYENAYSEAYARFEENHAGKLETSRHKRTSAWLCEADFFYEEEVMSYDTVIQAQKMHVRAYQLGANYMLRCDKVAPSPESSASSVVTRKTISRPFRIFITEEDVKHFVQTLDLPFLLFPQNRISLLSNIIDRLIFETTKRGKKCLAISFRPEPWISLTQLCDSGYYINVIAFLIDEKNKQPPDTERQSAPKSDGKESEAHPARQNEKKDSQYYYTTKRNILFSAYIPKMHASFRLLVKSKQIQDMFCDKVTLLKLLQRPGWRLNALPLVGTLVKMLDIVTIVPPQLPPIKRNVLVLIDGRYVEREVVEEQQQPPSKRFLALAGLDERIYEAKRNVAATGLQKIFRGFKGRQWAKDFKPFIGALTIQCAWRSRQARILTSQKRRTYKRKMGSTKFQSCWRRYLCRKAFPAKLQKIFSEEDTQWSTAWRFLHIQRKAVARHNAQPHSVLSMLEAALWYHTLATPRNMRHASRLYDRLVKTAASNPVVMICSGLFLLMSGDDFTKARTYISTGLKLDPTREQFKHFEHSYFFRAYLVQPENVYSVVSYALMIQNVHAQMPKAMALLKAAKNGTEGRDSFINSVISTISKMSRHQTLSAVTLQRIWRGWFVRSRYLPSLLLMAAQRKYDEDPKDFFNAQKLALAKHAIELDVSGARDLYDYCLKEDPKDVTSLLGRGLLLIGNCIAKVDIRQGHADISSAKVLDKDLIGFILPEEAYFRAVIRSGWLSHPKRTSKERGRYMCNFGLVLQWVHEKEGEAMRWFHKAINNDKTDDLILRAYQKFFDGTHSASRGDKSSQESRFRSEAYNTKLKRSAERRQSNLSSRMLKDKMKKLARAAYEKNKAMKLKERREQEAFTANASAREAEERALMAAEDLRTIKRSKPRRGSVLNNRQKKKKESKKM